VTLPRPTVRLVIEVIGALAFFVFGLGVGAWRILTEEKAIVEHFEARYEKHMLFLGASLLVCREGEEWPGIDEWIESNPGCDWDCVLKRLILQAEGSEAKVTTAWSWDAPQDGLRGPSKTAPCILGNGLGVVSLESPTHAHSGHRDSVRRGVAPDATPRERGVSSVGAEVLAIGPVAEHAVPVDVAAGVRPVRSSAGAAVVASGPAAVPVSIAGDFSAAFPAGVPVIRSVVSHSLLLFPRGLHGAHPQVSTSSLRANASGLGGAEHLATAGNAGRLGGGLPGLDSEAGPNNFGLALAVNVDGVAAFAFGGHVRLLAHHDSNIGTAVPIGKWILSGVFPE
jgi:hypothetical protein